MKVFNEYQGIYEDGVIVERNLFTNRIEKQAETTGCNITSLSIIDSIQDTVSVLNHSGFNTITENTEIYIQVRSLGKVAIIFYSIFNVGSLYYPINYYEGKIFQLNMSCHLNTRIDCIVFKINGTANFKEG